MWTLLTGLMKFLSGRALKQLFDYMRDDKRYRAQITRDAIDGELRSRQLAKEVLIAEQGWWVTALIRPLFAYPVVLHFGAMVADSIFHFEWLNVEPLPEPFGSFEGWIVAAYFLTRPFEKIARGYHYSKGWFN